MMKGSNELIDIFDKDGKLTNVVKTVKEVHEEGLWHQAAHVWVFNSKGEILLQKRSMNVPFPGLWDISAAGQISSGEDPEQTAVRELYEETGIKADISELKKIEVRKASNSMPERNWFNNEFNHIYLCKFEGDISELNLQEDEVDEIKFISLDDFEKEINDPELSKKYVPHGKYYLDIIKAIRNEIS